MFDRAPVHSSGLLDVGGAHRIYWEESGAAAGIPALYLHGGPGGTLGSGDYRRALDPARFRIIGLDQRGCGRSRPHVTEPGYELGQNTTAHLVADLERLREFRGVDRWLLNGVSWGSTLALAYAQEHPGRVLGVVLTAVTTTDRFQVEWITETVSAIYPEAWDRLATHAEQAGVGYRRHRDRLIDAYATLMKHPGPAVVAWELHRAWSGSELIIDEGDGHGGASMAEARCAANTRHAHRIDAAAFDQPGSLRYGCRE